MLPVGMVQNNPSYYRDSICIRLVSWNFGVCLQYRVYYFVDKQNDWKSKSGNLMSKIDSFIWIFLNSLLDMMYSHKNCFFCLGTMDGFIYCTISIIRNVGSTNCELDIQRLWNLFDIYMLNVIIFSIGCFECCIF